jgi:hypothetical protein
MEFTVRGSLSLEDKKTGKMKCVARNVVTRINIPVGDIYAYEEVVSSRGKLLKNSCRLYLTNDLKEIVVNKSYKKVKELKSNIAVTGFYARDTK